MIYKICINHIIYYHLVKLWNTDRNCNALFVIIAFKGSRIRNSLCSSVKEQPFFYAKLFLSLWIQFHKIHLKKLLPTNVSGLFLCSCKIAINATTIFCHKNAVVYINNAYQFRSVWNCVTSLKCNLNSYSARAEA